MFHFQSKKRESPIVIYQMGKVGSTALASTLRGIWKPVFQVHTLVPEHIERIEESLRRNFLGSALHLQHSKKVLKDFLEPGRDVFFICPIRSPLERNLSAFFQELCNRVLSQKVLSDSLGLTDRLALLKKLPLSNNGKNVIFEYIATDRLSSKIEVLQNYFNSHYPHDLPMKWCETELMSVTGIDVMNDFDVGRGYSFYKRDHMNLLVYKSELSDAQKGVALTEFLGLGVSKVLNSHRSSRKRYGVAFRDFKESLVLTSPVREKYANSRYLKAFYPELSL